MQTLSSRNIQRLEKLSDGDGNMKASELSTAVSSAADDQKVGFLAGLNILVHKGLVNTDIPLSQVNFTSLGCPESAGPWAKKAVDNFIQQATVTLTEEGRNQILPSLKKV